MGVEEALRKKSLDRHLKYMHMVNFAVCDEIHNTVLNSCMHEVTKHPDQMSQEHEKATFHCFRSSFKDKSNASFKIHFAIAHTGTSKH